MSSERKRSARVIAVTSGKGGVGKTNVSVNLSVAMARMGRRTLLVDGDLGLANANILLGLNAQRTIGDVLGRGLALDEVVQRGPGGLMLLPGHSGHDVVTGLDRHDRSRLADTLRPMADALDYVVLDTASGISPQNMALASASDMVLLVLSAEPTAFMDAYALVKVLAVEHGCASISVVTNQAEGEAGGRELFRHFREVVKRFLPVTLFHLGSIPRDPSVREAVFRRSACVEAFPDAPASAAFNRLARTISDAELPAGPGGDSFFGMEALHGAH